MYIVHWCTHTYADGKITQRNNNISFSLSLSLLVGFNSDYVGLTHELSERKFYRSMHHAWCVLLTLFHINARIMLLSYVEVEVKVKKGTSIYKGFFSVEYVEKCNWGKKLRTTRKAATNQNEKLLLWSMKFSSMDAWINLFLG